MEHDHVCRVRTQMHPLRVAFVGRIALLGLLSLPRMIAAQDIRSSPTESVRIVGYIVDRATERAIPSAIVTLVPLANDEPIWSGSSDSNGFFNTEVVPLGSYEIRVEVTPFSRLTHLLVLAQEGIVDVRVELVTVDYELPPIVVVVTRGAKLEANGFYERRAAGRGTFLTRDEIAERSPSRLSELFRTIPGARIVQGQSGEGNSVRLRGACAPVYVLDGIVLAGTVVIDDVLPVAGVEGIEVYHGAAAPMQYVGLTSCGVVMLWGREAGSGAGSRPLSWKRVLAAVGFAALVVLITR